MEQYQKILHLWQTYAVESPAGLDKYLSIFHLLFACDSGRLENSEITCHDMLDDLENSRVAGFTGNPRALFELQNQKLCYEFLKNKIISREPLSLELVREIHRVLAAETYDQRHYIENEECHGEFRKHDYITGIIGSDVKKVEAELSALLDEVNAYDGAETIKAAAYLHARFEYVRPFADGNGRVGRTLLNYYLMTHNHPPLFVYDEDKNSYYAALRAYDEFEEIAPLLDFLRQQTEKTWKKPLTLSEKKALIKK